MDGPSLGENIRRFFTDLFRSHHVKFLESELVRSRLHYEALMREMKEEKLQLEQKLGKFELAMWPQMRQFSPDYQRARAEFAEKMKGMMGSPAHWKEALDEHNREMERLYNQQEQSHGITDAGS